MYSQDKGCCKNCFHSNCCCIECCKGERGPMGPTGPVGAQGIQGAKGDSFTYDDFTPEQLESLKGPQGAQGIQGEQGIQGVQGNQGEKGEQGEPFSRVYGMFAGVPLGPFSGAGMFDTTIIPVTNIRPVTTPDAFVLNDNGTVTVNQSGIYLITSKIQVDTGHTANFFFQVNERGARSGSQGGYTVMNGGTATITTIYALNAGDRVSNSISSITEIYLTPFVDNLRTFSSVITMLKIAELPTVGITESGGDDGLLLQ